MKKFYGNDKKKDEKNYPPQSLTYIVLGKSSAFGTIQIGHLNH